MPEIGYDDVRIIATPPMESNCCMAMLVVGCVLYSVAIGVILGAVIP